MRVLVAEDEAISRRKLISFLSSWGYEVQAVEDGTQAWDILSKVDPPQIAILDWIMPGMYGPEVVQKVRQRSPSVPVYIILLTSQDRLEDTVQGFEAGADEYVIKPFNPQELQVRIKAGERVLHLQAALSSRVADLEGALSARLQAEEALRQSEERSRLLFTAIPNPVWVYDLETLRFLEINDAAAAHYGYSRSEFLNMKVSDIRLSGDAEGQGVGGPAQEPREGESGQRKHRLKNGRVIDVQVSAHSVDFADRKAVLAVAEDITERKRLEVELRHAQKLEAVGGLAAGIAHEINTPIQFVGDNVRFLNDAFSGLRQLVGRYQELNASEGLEGRRLEEVQKAEEAADLPYLTEEIPKAIGQTLDGIERVATIVRAMKDFAHPDLGEMAAADLNKALESTLVVARNELKYVANVEADFGDLPLVPCLLGDLNQVFLNLLINAAHAIGDVMKKTGNKGLIRVTTKREGRYVTVAISDTGTGIPGAIQNKIFEPFFTTKEVGRGTGQGLAIARSIVVEKHKGMLTFESESGKGTTFFIRLPLEPEPLALEKKSA